MSTMKEDTTKIVLPRTGPDLFWKEILENYAGDDLLRWRLLGMLALRDVCHWPVDRIGKAFDISKGHVTRSLNRVKEELYEKFDMPRTMFTEDSDS